MGSSSLVLLGSYYLGFAQPPVKNSNSLNKNQFTIKKTIMSRNRKCRHGAMYFRFDFPLSSEGVFFDNLTIDGYACMEAGKAYTDIDSVEYRGTEVKPLLEIFGGMHEVDGAAEAHVKGLFEVNQLQVA